MLLLADAQTSGGLLVVGEVPGLPVIGEVVPPLGPRHRRTLSSITLRIRLHPVLQDDRSRRLIRRSIGCVPQRLVMMESSATPRARRCSRRSFCGCTV